MKGNRSVFLLYSSVLALIFYAFWSPSLVKAEHREGNSDLPQEEQPETTPETEQNPESKPESGQNPKPEPDPESNPEPEQNPNPDPDPEPEEAEENHDSNGDQPTKPISPTKPNKPTKPSVEPKPTRPKQNPTPSNNWSNPNVKVNPTTDSSSNLPSNDTVEQDQEETNDTSVEEVKEEPEVDKETPLKIDLTELSWDELLEGLDRGELLAEIRENRYYLVDQETKEAREITEEEAIEIGLLEDIEMKETEIEEADIIEPAPEDVKSEKSNTSLYISLVGLSIILIGALLYFLQVRKSRG